MVRRFHQPGPILIAIGVAWLLAATCWPALPVISSMSLVALGAMLEVIPRGNRARQHWVFVAAHLLVYANLYLIFIGAMLHAAMAGPRHGLSWLQGLDLLLSIGPMAVAFRLAVACLARGEDSAARR